jgi:hypothetical protein
LRRFVKPSLGGKAFKSEPPVVFFPLDPKKRHLQWATWWVFGSIQKQVAFPKIRKSATTNLKTGGASALPFLRPFSRWRVAFKTRERLGVVLRNSTAQSRDVQKFPPCHSFQVDSLACWMRHPNPFISLLSFMLLFRIRANSHQQPLNDLP